MNYWWLLVPAIGVLLVSSMSNNGLSLIKRWEGFSHVPYKDTSGNLTIGYGHKILPNEQFTWISKDQAEALLMSDLKIAEKAVKEKVSVPLSKNQFDALVSFVFNVGIGNFSRSTLLKLLNAGEYAKAADEFRKWIFVTINQDKVEDLGLVARRKHEYNLFVS